MPIPELLNSLRDSLTSNSFLKKYAEEKPPLRSELFSADQMEEYGKVLAKRHKLILGKSSNTLLKRLAGNEELLIEVHQLLTESVKAKQNIIPAGEWLLDNFYLIQEQIRVGKKHLPKSYNENLPRIKNETEVGIPRVYDIALEIISHSDGRIDLKSLTNFIQAYQTSTPLQIGELWAIPIMLRLALIENLRRLSTQIANDRINQNLANFWASQMILEAEKDPKGLILIIADMARSKPPLVSAFVAEMSRQLQGKGQALALPLNWIEQVLSESGQTGNELIHQEIQKQAIDQVTMSNCIGSLRFLGITNWQEFVESLSIVEQIMRTDLDGIYADMDFSTRDQYRHVIENLAKSSTLNEAEVAHLATRLSKEGIQTYGLADRRSHVGYYLMGKGIPQLENQVKPKIKPREMFIRWILKHPFRSYVGSVGVVSVLIALSLCFRVYMQEGSLVRSMAISLLTLISASYLSITLINWFITLLINPKVLPRMGFTNGIPEEYRTLVIIPCMLSGVQEIDELIERLEVHYLANKMAFLHFALLTDFKDSIAETLPEDQFLIEYTRKKIQELNVQYKDLESEVFCWFHRPRKWNPKERIWMGYERKRGKLTELNDFLKGYSLNCFSEIIGDPAIFPNIKYVITLDSDTTLPRDAACKMIASMAHPLNRAYYDDKLHRVTYGYGILQPRVAISLPGTSNSLYASMQGNDLGIDPYSKTTSDVYQDLFEEGSFVGKGIYEVDIFRKGMDNRFPENRILSHDLLEGCYLRSGLLTDVQLYEEYPIRYSTDIKRRTRWIRGDWQIAAWIFPWVPKFGGGIIKNPLSAVSRWKIFDNLRRSLVSISLILLLISGWTILHDALYWSYSISFLLIFPPILMAIRDLFSKPREITLKQHFQDSFRAILDDIFQNLFLITCLPYEAFYNIKAISITLWRVLVSHKNLLVWNPARIRKRKEPNHFDTESLADTYIQMAIAPILGFLGILYFTIYSPMDHLIADPILLLWIFSPYLAWYISRPIASGEVHLNRSQTQYLRHLARKTWAFFETFVVENENWLPPDNYQEHPNPKIAHRTSPTNIGLSLVANLAATDFGYSTIGNLVSRTQKTFATMNKMERFKGHFYNWYDTLTLEPLNPRYISTVDSGNLSSHLLTLRQGLLQKIREPILNRELFIGIKDTLEIFPENVKSSSDYKSSQQIIEEILIQDSLPINMLKPWVRQLVSNAKNLDKLGASDRVHTASISANGLISQCEQVLQAIDLYFITLDDDELLTSFSELLPTKPNSSLLDISEIKENFHHSKNKISTERTDGISESEEMALGQVEIKLEQISRKAKDEIFNLEELARECIKLAEIEFDFLYDASQDLFSIGYNVQEQKKDGGYYDLLASEARICAFLAISEGKIPQKSWFSLGRQLTNSGGNSVLLSWSGSMFEYLMPLLIMPTYKNTLLDQTYHTMLERQIEYGKKVGVPWGISESGYNLVDAQLNYQYRAFGVPELGLMRGLGEDLVIAPYASVMALMINPREALKNLEFLHNNEFEGDLGFYEAIDYTPSRLPRGQNWVVIQSYMAHHKGMSLLALDYLLCNKPMQSRFMEEPLFQASILLLQERIPKSIKFFTPPPDVVDLSKPSETTELRVIKTAATILPEIQLLSNGNYHVMITNAGGGYSRYKNLAVTRWQEDSTRDAWGTFCYIRDLDSGAFFSNTHQPSLKEAKSYEAIFAQGRAEFKRVDLDLETHSEIVVSQEDNVEIRRIHLTNRSKKRRSIEVTTYAEVVLASTLSDALHPAFSNLFIETEINSIKNAIICTRRPRSLEENNIWLVHLVKVDTKDIQKISYETDRSKFIGRNRNLEFPYALEQDYFLSGTEGPVLDPIVSIQYRIKMNPNESVSFDIVYGVGESRKIAEDLLEKYQDTTFINRAFELAWTQNQVVLRQINANERDAEIYDKLAGSILFSHASLRADPNVLVKNQKGQSGLWSYSISGDFPIVLVRITNQENISLIQNMVRAHAYWKLKGLTVDLIIWNEELSGYRQEMQNQILALISDGSDRDVHDHPGGIYVRSFDQIAVEDRILMQSVARIEISDLEGSISYQANKRNVSKASISNLIPSLFPIILTEGREWVNHENLSVPDLLEWNGIGGFSLDGLEYIIKTDKEHICPAPWVNVLANPNFGTLISESGQSYTWAINAHEFRLSPWNNDSVTDSSGEAFYIRDDESGNYWSPTALPRPGNTNYLTRHGFGYSEFDHFENGIFSTMTVFVDLTESVKFTILKIKNNSQRSRYLSITGYIEWVLGDLRSKSMMHIQTEKDEVTGSIIARNTYNKEFNDQRVSYFDINDPKSSLTADRTEFIGRNGSLSHPLALTKVRLSGKTGAALDPCAAFQSGFLLEEGEEREIIFLLGSSHTLDQARNTLQKFKRPGVAAESLANVKNYWGKTVSKLKVFTPDNGFNMLTNGWLLYQTLVCRFWARTGFYQSGGAFGFRDQLQDSMALIDHEPDLVKAHLLLSASKQFAEGDVLHWWHPPSGRGVRTRCSDDFLWLVLATCRYVKITGDEGILDIPVHFVEGRLLHPEEESYYDAWNVSREASSLYDHLVKAIRYGLPTGVHGLPLMGSGDWNDGMDKVGIEGKGESVWLAFFLYYVLSEFMALVRTQKEPEFLQVCVLHSENLKQHIESETWDGNWYKRAFFDDGTPLGSSINSECKIDSITQSWSVLSEAATLKRSTHALEAANQNLVRKDLALIQLLDPPFDKGDLNPGYIKGYVPGVRENGGQYTHAAIWLVMAYCKLKLPDKAWELFTLINPVEHANSAQKIKVYQTEPYVVAADVYRDSLHPGKGGWTWYTGSAGWMYRLLTESFIGFVKEGDSLRFYPCIPTSWDEFKVEYRYLDTLYQIRVLNPKGENEGKDFVKLDGDIQQTSSILLKNDLITHKVEIMIGHLLTETIPKI